MIDHVRQEPIECRRADRTSGAGTQRKGTKARQHLVVLHERGALLVARIDHVGPSGPPDGVAVCVHLEQVLSLASGETLDSFRLGRARAVELVRRCELLVDELDAVLGIEVQPHGQLIGSDATRKPVRPQPKRAVGAHRASPGRVGARRDQELTVEVEVGGQVAPTADENPRQPAAASSREADAHPVARALHHEG